DEAPVRAQSGWRREVFGEAALRLKHGKIALAADGKRVRVIEL
ncbi:MAG: ribonuclease D, partial [Alphaproteobacteria bacterium]